MTNWTLYVISEWVIASAAPLPVPDPMKFRVSCHLMVEVHPIKGAAKQKRNKISNLKIIHEILHTILMDPVNTLCEVLLDTYTLLVRDVSQSPLKVISKVKDEEMWVKVQGACDDRSLGSLFMQHVTAQLQRELPYEIKVIPHKDRDSSVTSASSAVDVIVTKCNL